MQNQWCHSEAWWCFCISFTPSSEPWLLSASMLFAPLQGCLLFFFLTWTGWFRRALENAAFVFSFKRVQIEGSKSMLRRLCFVLNITFRRQNKAGSSNPQPVIICRLRPDAPLFSYKNNSETKICKDQHVAFIFPSSCVWHVCIVVAQRQIPTAHLQPFFHTASVTG